MANIVELHKPLTFGKHKGLTGAELMKSEAGVKYLIWFWNNTDVQIDAHIANALIAHGLIDMSIERRNSIAGGGTVTVTAADKAKFPEVLEEAIKAASRNIPSHPYIGTQTKLFVDGQPVRLHEALTEAKFKDVISREVNKLGKDIVF